MEKFVDRKEIFTGKVIRVVVDDVEIDDGSRAKREVVYHHGGACIALRNQDGKYFLVRQYRYALEKEMLEFCAGKLEQGEDPLTCVVREAREELGYEAVNVVSLGYIVPTCGYCSEKIYLFYGECGKYLGQDLDPDERLGVVTYSLKELKEMLKRGEIDDAKTLALMYRIELEGLDG